MTQDVTDGTINIVMADGEQFDGSDAGWFLSLMAECSLPTVEYILNAPKLAGCWILRLMLAGFCFTLMAGCSLTYKGPQYDLSTLAGLRPEPVRHRTQDGMLSQQRHPQRSVLPR